MLIRRGYLAGLKKKLEWLAGRTDEIAQDGNVGAVSSNASGVHGQTEAFRKIKIYTRVIQL